MYDSALRDLLLEGNEKVIEDVIPQLIAYKAIMNIKRIRSNLWNLKVGRNNQLNQEYKF